MIFRAEIDGLSCASCVRRVETALQSLAGVASARANLATHSVEVHYDQPATPGALANGLAEAGYPARQHSQRFDVDGLSCASCVRRLETALSDAPGVLSARVNLADNTATITSLEDTTTAVQQAAAKAGYPVTPQAAQPSQTAPDTLGRDTAIAFALVLPVFLVEMGGHLYPPIHHFVHQAIGLQTSQVLQFLLIGATLIGPGRRFFAKGLPALMRRAPEMNALVAIGTFAAFAYSTAVTFFPNIFPPTAQKVYFEAAGVIVVLILFGRMLEARAKSRANTAIRALSDLQPDIAHVVENGRDIDRPVAALQPGDLIRIRPGERIPTDGTVVDGTSLVDEAMISGEPLPVAKSPEHSVIGATINGEGVLTVKVTRTGTDTVLSGIIAMVRDAQATKLPVEAIIDRVTAWFVPAVLLVAVLTLAVWLVANPSLAIVAAVSVLIIACPCAMGLAVPMSIMVGMARGAKAGVLFRQGEAVERLRHVKTVAFDKTGTLTEGRPTLAHIDVTGGFDRDQVLALAAAVEAQSQHPIAKAITAAIPKTGETPFTATNVHTVTGKGIEGTVGDKTVRIGNAVFMKDAGIDVSPLEDTQTDRMASGATAFYLSVNDTLAGLLSVADPIKPGSARTIATLHSMGLKTAMISGDATRTAQSVADTLGIDHVIADALPDTKLDHIRALSKNGPVAFIGDGINDAPALAAADVGIALGTGTDVAMETADVVLMSGDPQGAATAIALSSAVMRNVKQNLGWAFGYNILLIPVAAGLLYPSFGLLLSPMLAAGAMAFSSVAVVTNSLRLRSSQL